MTPGDDPVGLFPTGREPDGEDSEVHIFVDEAGDPTLFHSSGKQIVGTEGCSRYFIMGKLEVADPVGLSGRLNTLRSNLLANPYYQGVESLRPERKKTALKFHANDDMPEVRKEVFDLLASEGKGLRFHAVVCDKEVLAQREDAQRAKDPGYRYQPNALYDGLIRSLFGKLHAQADIYHLCIARRGQKNRNAALKTAIEHAERDFERGFGFSRGGVDRWRIVVSDPVETACLQAVDYFLWALQRLYEPRVHEKTGETVREERFLLKVWPQVIEVHDLDFGSPAGTFYGPQRALTAEDRFGKQDRGRKKKGS